MAIILTKDNKMKFAEIADFERMRREIGAELLEPVNVCPGVRMWGDEKSKCKAHTVNLMASMLYRAIHGGDYMAGTVVVVGEDANGDIRDLTTNQALRMVALLRKLRYLYHTGKLGKFEATGPKCSIVSFDSWEDMLAYMNGKPAPSAKEVAQ
jgi:hypothetical protein